MRTSPSPPTLALTKRSSPVAPQFSPHKSDHLVSLTGSGTVSIFSTDTDNTNHRPISSFESGVAKVRPPPQMRRLQMSSFRLIHFILTKRSLRSLDC